MILVDSSKQVYFLIQKVKQASGLLITNLFLDEQKLEKWVQDGLLFYIETAAGVILLRKNLDFFHLYYNVSSISELSSLVQSIPSGLTIVVDIIGYEKAVTPVINVFSDVSFKVKTSLNRYIRVNNRDSSFYQPHIEVELASAEYKEIIAEMLSENFDKYSEQVPSLEDVEELIRDRKILFIKGEQKVKGFIVRTISGQSTILNNFLVDKDLRGQRLGSRLLQHYIFECRSLKRMILWVIHHNDKAINLYKQHGYVKDALTDTIMIKNYKGE